MATFCCCCCCDCVMSSTSIVLFNDVINVLGGDERCVHTCWHLRRTAPYAAPGQCSRRASLTSRVCWWWLQVLCRLIYDTCAAVCNLSTIALSCSPNLCYCDALHSGFHYMTLPALLLVGRLTDSFLTHSSHVPWSTSEAMEINALTIII